MARGTQLLSDRRIRTLKEPGRYADGAGLYLVVDEKGRRWVFMWKTAGKRREMGLGSLTNVSLALAREMAAEARDKVARGIDPIRDRKAQKASSMTFGELAREFLDDHLKGFSNQAHKRQWRLHLEGYAKPLHDIPVDAVTVNDVLKVLRPIWTEKAESASRIRGRIAKVLAAAKARGLRTGENPAAWSENLEFMLSRRNQIRRHHAAMPYTEVPGFMEELRARSSLSARALEWTILTVGRTEQTILANWSEIDRQQRLWVIPAHRMKMPREHFVPLTSRMEEILDALPRTGPLLFKLSNMAMLNLLAGMRPRPDDPKKGLYTVHGFRSSFRDWGGNETTIEREVLEGCLAHVLKDKTEAAYRRGVAVQKHRAALEWWQGYCA